jgi:hypothetical protein
MGMAFWERVSQIEHFALLMAFRYLEIFPYESHRLLGVNQGAKPFKRIDGATMISAQAFLDNLVVSPGRVIRALYNWITVAALSTSHGLLQYVQSRSCRLSQPGRLNKRRLPFPLADRVMQEAPSTSRPGRGCVQPDASLRTKNVIQPEIRTEPDFSMARSR